MHTNEVVITILLAVALSGCVASDTLGLDIPLLHERITATYADRDAGAELFVDVGLGQTWLADGSRAEAVILRLVPGSENATVPAAAYTYDMCLQPVARVEEGTVGKRLDFRMLLDPPPPIVPTAGQMLESDRDTADAVRRGAIHGDGLAYRWGEPHRQVVVAVAGENEVFASMQDTDPGVTVTRVWRWLSTYGAGNDLPTRIQPNTWRGQGDWRLVDHEATGDLIGPRCDAPVEVPAAMTQMSARATTSDPPFHYHLSEAIQAAEMAPAARELPAFLATHEDAYIEAWTYTQIAFTLGEARRVPPTWQLTYAAPNETQRVVVACTLVVDVTVGPPQAARSGCTDSLETSDTAAGPNPAGQEVSAYEHWFALFQEVFGKGVTEARFLWTDAGLIGTLHDPQLGTVDMLDYDATRHRLHELEGEFDAIWDS